MCIRLLKPPPFEPKRLPNVNNDMSLNGFINLGSVRGSLYTYSEVYHVYTTHLHIRPIFTMSEDFPSVPDIVGGLVEGVGISNMSVPSSP